MRLASTIAALVVICGVAAAATAHHPAKRFRDPAKAQTRLYVAAIEHGLDVGRDESDSGSSKRVRAQALKLWARLHPYQERRHVVLTRRAAAARKARERASRRAAMWERVASCECASWTCDTGNGYQGGLQMDSSFQATYGSEFIRRWGGAHNWPKWAQMAAADRAYATRGLGPWPNCGHARLGYRPVP